MQRIEEANRLPGGRGLTGQGRHGSLSYCPPPASSVPFSFMDAFSAFLSSACPMLEKFFNDRGTYLFHSLNLLFVWFLFSLVSNSKEQTKTRLKQTISLPVS